MKLGFLYSGQGSQETAMGWDLYKEYDEIREFYDGIDLETPVRDLSFHGSLEEISKTENTQPILLAFQIAVTKLLYKRGIRPDLIAGLSLGEYGGLYAANILDEMELLRLVEKRAQLMAEASKGIETRMLAILGSDYGQVEKICKNLSGKDSFVEISNLNCPGQIIISGEKRLVEKAEELIREGGVKRIVELNVSGPFHTSYMEGVSQELKKYLDQLDFRKKEIDIVHNINGRPVDDREIKKALYLQVKERVEFEKSLKYMLDRGIKHFVEIGFNGVIRSFLKRLDRKAKVYEVNSLESLREFIGEMEKYEGKKTCHSYRVI